jgi:8-oxo-dGTP pyrophosphatase MutT (NUDIX family)
MNKYYCQKCNSDQIDEVTENNQVIYFCSECGKKSDRVVNISDKMIIKKDEQGRLKHASVGVLISKNEKILLAKRRTFPFAYSIIAGHLDMGETPEEGAKREVFEETGLTLSNLELIFEGDLENSCRKGANIHEWHLYRAKTEEEAIKTTNEHEFLEWYNIEEINDLELSFIANYFLKEKKYVHRCAI